MYPYFIFLVILSFYSCVSSKPKSESVAEIRKGLLITGGTLGDFYFIDSVGPSDKMEGIFDIVDSSKVAKRLFYFYGDIKDSISAFMKKFPDDLNLCGTFSEDSQIKYLFVTMDVMNKEYSMTPFWKKEYGWVSDICIVNIKHNKHGYLKFRNANWIVRSISAYE